MKTIQSTKPSVIAQATVVGDAERWFTRLRAHDTTDIERAQYEKWLDHSEDNRRSARDCQQVWNLADALASDPEVLAFAEPERRVQAVSAPPRVPRSSKMLHRMIAPAALAASIALAVGLVRPDVFGIGPHRYGTDIGEQRRVVLDDGSVMQLNTDTAVEVSYSEQARQVKILGGEATFSVQHDRSRPFIVHAGNGFVRAVGTRFNVYSTPERVTVAVLEGAVVVGHDGCDAKAQSSTEAHGSPSASPACTQPASAQSFASPGDIARLPVISAGEEVTYSAQPIAPLPIAAPATELRRVKAWQKGKLEFDAVPLGSALTEINRYLTRKIVLGDSRLADIRISGVFRVGETDSVIFALREMLGVSASFRASDIQLNAPVNDNRSITL
jgi:transmembrane sensor